MKKQRQGRTAKRPGVKRRSADTHRLTVSSTEAQNEFGRMLDEASQDGEVVITRHGHPKAVLLSVARYEQLQERESTALAALSGQFDDMIANMQTKPSRDGVDRLFEASPEELGQAAVAAAGGDDDARRAG